jgi:hypothetical protein
VLFIKHIYEYRMAGDLFPGADAAGNFGKNQIEGINLVDPETLKKPGKRDLHWARLKRRCCGVELCRLQCCEPSQRDQI